MLLCFSVLTMSQRVGFILSSVPSHRIFTDNWKNPQNLHQQQQYLLPSLHSSSKIVRANSDDESADGSSLISLIEFDLIQCIKKPQVIQSCGRRSVERCLQMFRYCCEKHLDRPKSVTLKPSIHLKTEFVKQNISLLHFYRYCSYVSWNKSTISV